MSLVHGQYTTILYIIHVCMHGMILDARGHAWKVNMVWKIWKVNNESSYWLLVLDVKGYNNRYDLFMFEIINICGEYGRANCEFIGA